VADNFLNASARTLTAGRRAFINCTRRFLVNEYATLLSKDETVIEMLETVEPDAEVLAACRRLKRLGYVSPLLISKPWIGRRRFSWSELKQPRGLTCQPT
jgi:EAL and modified HD-GYP domain-containing signal transduction protein